MNAIGIITEYNPFHRGHKWQIDELRRRSAKGRGRRRIEPHVQARLRGKRLRGQKGFDNAPYSAVNYC
mgnify:CR=1 FL=1